MSVAPAVCSGLAEIRLTRPLTAAEQTLAAGIADTLGRRIPDETEYDVP